MSHAQSELKFFPWKLFIFNWKDNYVMFEGTGKKELVLRECVQGFIPKQ
jgi:hypothetical protein